jgi:hypothetical protein
MTLSVDASRPTDLTTLKGATTSTTLTISTTGTNRIILVFVATETITTARTVSSVSASGLTFAKRSGLGYTSNTGGYLGNMECWWAYAAAQQTNLVITVTISGACDSGCAAACAIAGVTNTTAPWDPNVSLPATNVNNTTTANTSSATGITTRFDNTIDLFLWSSGVNPPQSLGVPTGHSNIHSITNISGVVHDSQLITEQRVNSAVLSAVTIQASSGTQKNWGVIVDALTADVALTPALFSDTDTFFAPTVAPGAITLTPSLYTDTDSFFAPTASASYTLTASLITDTDTFAAPTVSQSGQSLTPSLFSDTDSFYSATISTSIELTAALYADTDTFSVPTVTAGAITLTPSLVTDADSFFAPSIANIVSLEPALYTDTDSFFSPAVVATDIVLPALYSDADVFFAPIVGTVISPSLHVDTDTIFSLTVTSRYTLFPEIVNSEAQIWVPVDSAINFVQITTYLDQDLFFTPTVQGGSISINPPLYVDQDTFWSTFVARQKKNGNSPGTDPGNVIANLKYASQIVLTDSGLITSLEVQSSSAQAINTRMMVYADASGLPGALLGQTNTKSSVVLGDNDYTMIQGVSIVAGQTIWVALHSDGDFKWFLQNLRNGGRYNNDTFSDGPSNPFGASSIDHKQAPVFVILLESASTSILPSLVQDQDQIYSPTQTNTKQLLLQALTDTDFFYPNTLLPLSILLPSLVASDDSIFIPSILRGSVTLEPSLFQDSDVIFSGFVLFTLNNIGSVAIPVDDQIYEATVTLEGANLPPILYQDEDIFFSPVVLSTYFLQAEHEIDFDTFYLPQVIAGEVTIEPPLLSAGEDFYDPFIQELNGTRTILPPLYVDEDAFYAINTRKFRFRKEFDILGVDASAEAFEGGRTSTRSIEGRPSGGINLKGRAEPRKELV